MLFWIAAIFPFYQELLGYSFTFFTRYGVFEYTSLGIKYFGEPVFPVITSATVFVVMLFFLSLAPLLITGLWISFIRPFKDVKGFEKSEKVSEVIEFLTVQGSKREKLIFVAFMLTSILAALFFSIVFLGWFGILTLNIHYLIFLTIPPPIFLLVALHFESRVQRLLKKYGEIVQT
ncbi:MAG: hypothetical protein QXR19_01440 [Candidatus Jordarchaeaceae archaeon]